MTLSPAVLSEDLIVEVLSFLPVKSLLQFRCVSKSWKTLISDPTFVKLHLEKSQSRNLKLFTIITERINNNNEGDYRVDRYPIDRIFENPSNYHHFKRKGSRNGSDIVGSYFGFAFGCDNSTATYKVVAYGDRKTTSDSEVKVLNLGDDVWRNIDSFDGLSYRGELSVHYVNLSGTLNWLAIHNNIVQQFTIVSLDLGRRHTINTWCLVMKKFGVEDSWTQLFKFSYHDLLIDHDDFRLVPLFLSEDGDSLILQSSLESQTILYNRRDNRAKRTEIIASRTAANNRTSGYVYWDFAKDYVESLVPIF
ncbi:uncharacterized protein [Medicago truncatula]|uniref:uncharacterized protein n=1 Tax=Medicago truncatula TaxID=3880 RepID=UPI000D2F473F|nr:uncharacterized protein LOC11428774 [Medicago truncatula]